MHVISSFESNLSKKIPDLFDTVGFGIFFHRAAMYFSIDELVGHLCSNHNSY